MYDDIPALHAEVKHWPPCKDMQTVLGSEDTAVATADQVKASDLRRR